MAKRRHVWALDFDGVLCDSCGESSLSAWRAAVTLWPSIFDTDTARQSKADIMEKMRAVRPVVETGYENIVQVRALLEGVETGAMLAGWTEMLPTLMDRWGLERSAMVDLFGETRDAWMDEDLEGWLAPNRIYDGVAAPLEAAMADPNCEVYIVTTKQARFTQVLLQNMAGIDFPMESIHSQTMSGRPKSEVLQMLQGRHPGHVYHFVEDKLATLKKVEKVPALEKWRLYLVDWGYNTPAERDEAAADPRIALIGMSAFGEMLD